MTQLESNKTDYLVSIAKGLMGTCPLIGPMAAEAIGTLIPNQRLDRVVAFLRELDARVSRIDVGLQNFQSHIGTPEGLDLLEEGLVQATRAVSSYRQERLVHVVSHALTIEELKYAESRKVLNLLRELTDPELLWLVYYSLNPVLGKGPHSELMERHPEVFSPVSRTFDSSQAELDRAAIQDSYRNTLARNGLIEHENKSYRISALGRIVVRYAEQQKGNSNPS